MKHKSCKEVQMKKKERIDIKNTLNSQMSTQKPSRTAREAFYHPAYGYSPYKNSEQEE